MNYKRVPVPSYPCVYSCWESEGKTWVVQDLRPEDDDTAMGILMHDMINDEVLCGIQKLGEDPVSVQEIEEFWRECLKQRMSLGCYVEENGEKTLVALNVCVPGSEGDEKDTKEKKGEKWKNVYSAFGHAESLINAYEYLGLKTLLHGFGLVTKRGYRGRRLGEKILAAREPLCHSQGIKGTVTLFSGIGSQKPATRCGFQTIAEFSIRELALAGYPYPTDDERIVKYMVKKYV